MKVITLLALAIAPATGFTTPAPFRASVAPTTAAARASPLFMVATSEDNKTSDQSPDLIIRQIEKKQAELNKVKDDAMAKLSEAKSSLKALDLQKQEYMNGQEIGDLTPPNFQETTLRSAVKAFAWRIIAGSVTFVTSYKFSGSYKTALTIVGSDFFSKAFTMFIGERLMNKSQAGRKSGSDAASRSLAKALIWRLFAICNTLTMAIFISKDLSVASKIAGSDAIFKTGLMFFYERVWARIQWGKEYLIEFSI